MKEPDLRYLVRLYIYLASTSVLLGVGITFLMLFICAYFEIDISKHFWIVAIPVVAAVILNITFVELLRHYRKR